MMPTYPTLRQCLPVGYVARLSMVRSASSTWPDRGWGRSADGRWWWDGTSWVPAYSPDGMYWWDGRQWSRVPAEPSGSHRALVLIGWVLTILVLSFDAVASLIAVNRSIGHDFTGAGFVLGTLCALIGPTVVFLVWWFDARRLRPRLPRIKRLAVVGLSVGIPLAFVAYQMASFKY